MSPRPCGDPWIPAFAGMTIEEDIRFSVESFESAIVFYSPFKKSRIK